jgi:ribonuclease HI
MDPPGTRCHQERFVISIYTDGSSHSSGGKPGGWAWVIVKKTLESGEQVLAAGYGGDPSTTNNRMELTGAIKGLEAVSTMYLPSWQVVELVSDSQYTLGMANGSYSPSTDAQGNRKNGDLVDRLQELARKYLSRDDETGRPRTRWVRGHDGDVFNTRCDSLAKRGKSEALRSGAPNQGS